MDPNRLTQKSQQAVQAAQSLALRSSHQEVDTIHSWLRCSTPKDGLFPRLLERMEDPPRTAPWSRPG